MREHVGLGTSRESMERAACVLDEILREWGLTLSIVKTKLIVAGGGDKGDRRPLQLEGGEVECVPDFKY